MQKEFHKGMSRTNPGNSRKLTLQILPVTGRKYSQSILEAKAKNWVSSAVNSLSET